MSLSTQLSIQDYLQLPKALVTDGSMETELARRGFHELPSDIYNLKSPVVVEEIHRMFLDAGAMLIQTNTQKANRYALSNGNFADKVYEINRKGVWIARTVALHKAYVAGVVGPTGKMLYPLGSVTEEDVHQAFVEQIIALIDGGADVIMFKSFIDIQELEIAIDAAQFVNPSIAILACKTFPEDGGVLSTEYPREIAKTLQNRGVLALGSNSTVGPQRMVHIVQGFTPSTTPLIALPDVGIPTIVNGIPVYSADPEYVASAAKRLVEQGVRIIGADGGAGYEYIKAIATIIDGVVPGSLAKANAPTKITSYNTVIEDNRSDFAKNFGQRFLNTVELDIPRGLDIQSVIEGAKYLKHHGIDAVNISDGARARLRMNSTVLSHVVQQQTELECITHIACRDRNMVALQSDLLAAYLLGVKNILAVTGDPAHIGDFPLATSVYDIDSVGLIRTLSRMNSGRDLAGNPLGNQTQFCISCACNPSAYDSEQEIDKLAQKAAEGANIAFTQPIFDIDILMKFLDKIQHIPIQIMVGIIPLRSLRHAEFLHYEVPGMTIPLWVRNAMKKHEASVEHASQEGVQIAVDFLEQAMPLVQGSYLMPPFKKYSMAIDILTRVGALSSTPKT